MKKKNRHHGSTFDSWLEAEGIRNDVTASAIKSVIAMQLAAEMKAKRITKTAMADKLKTSRAQLDPDNSSVTLDTLQRAAKAVGRQLRLELA